MQKQAKLCRFLVLVVFGSAGCAVPFIAGAFVFKYAGTREHSIAQFNAIRTNPTCMQPMNATSIRLELDEDPIHIAQSFCLRADITKTDTGLTALRSILAARAAGASRNRRYVIHIFADEFASWLLANNHSERVPHGQGLVQGSLDLFNEQWGDVLAHIDASDGRVELHIYPEDDAYAAAEQTLGNGSTLLFNHDGFKRCSPLRLLIPFAGGAMAQASKVVFLDMDLVMLCDAEQVLRIVCLLGGAIAGLNNLRFFHE
jgi:hypothetical protein